jgi:hypothetical protein
VEITSLAYRTDLMLLELSGSELTDRGEYVVVRTPANPSYWWGNYLLFRTAFAPGDTASRLELFHDELPDAKHVALGIDTVDGIAGAEDELVAAGLEIERSTVMTASQVWWRPAMQPGSARSPVTGCRRRSGWSPTGPVWRGSRMCRPIQTIVAGVWPARSYTRRRPMG